MSKFRYREMRSVFLGEKIASGSAREVYACRHDANFVVKIETPARSFQNIAEWETWEWTRGTDKAKWLAPCLTISATGYMLLQRRVTPMRKGERPKKIPAWLTDIKSENFGWLDGRVVCIDYGTILHGIRKLPDRMIAPKWRE